MVAGDPMNPDDLIHEKDVYERWGHLLADRELSEARKNGQIAFFNLRKGVHYTTADVMEYLKTRRVPACRATNEPLDPSRPAPTDTGTPPSASSSTGRNGSSGTRVVSFTGAGTTARLEQRAADQLVSET